MKARPLCLAIGAVALVMSSVSAAAVSSDDQKLAKSILLRTGDFPHGWQDTKQRSDDADHCLKPTFDDGSYPLAEAETTVFTDGQVGFASSFGIVYKANGAAAGGLEGISFAKVTKCLGDYFKSRQTSDIKYLGVASGKPAFPHLGEESRFGRVMIRLASKAGSKATFYIDVALIQRHRTVGVLEFEDLDSPLGAKLEERLARAVGQRMKQ